MANRKPLVRVSGRTKELPSGDKIAVADIDGLASVATTGAYPDLTGTPTLGDAAGKNVGTGAGTVAAGDDSRFGVVADNYVTDAKLRDSAALSVIGRSANSSGDPADIAAASDHQVLRRSGTSLGFGAINLAQSAAVTGVLPAANLPDASLTAKGIAELATAAEFKAGTDSARALVPSEVWGAADFTTLTDASTIALDFATILSLASCVLGGNRTLGDPSNAKPGQVFMLKFTATGATRTLTAHADFKLAPGVETGPWSITTSENLWLFGVVESASVLRVLNVVRFT